MLATTTRSPPIPASIQGVIRGVLSVASAAEGENASEHANLASNGEAGFGAVGV